MTNAINKNKNLWAKQERNYLFINKLVKKSATKSEESAMHSGFKNPSYIDIIFTTQPKFVTDMGVRPSLSETCHH